MNDRGCHTATIGLSQEKISVNRRSSERIRDHAFWPTPETRAGGWVIAITKPPIGDNVPSENV
jgi:hypothetical protein